MHTADRIDHGAAVAAEAARFAALLADADLKVPVPTCPGWTLADLVRHAGGVHRWFSVLLRQRIQQPPARREVDLRLPEREDGYAEWLRAGAAEAVEVFADTDPDAPMWVWGADGHARFWIRRMLFETLVHRVDAERALGLPSVVDPALARDGVDEFLVNLPFAALFAPKVAHLRGSGEAVRFRCTDGAGGSWLVRLRPDGFGLDADLGADGRAVPADAEVRAGAADLLLLLYGRLDRTAPGVETTGDGSLLDLWFANSAF
ncbi:maleylpyruvate isomerase family mycothiol-dependent enzyme [Streptomyces sp. W1SF4]|uniref:maleylpyruvate isomerase family mycothiol-dependent enzyme n=1 Tax=Streptomyces sp. W1SF4 TaxID=2305220 RepID=UPI000F718C71|nr:maleylpyruvate isomerase family mycothiol-dependent enzyme [Streptomyces sp. W1SF4]AZM87381.1 maleylpyruvate isomerase family mycothiol-dependent enzyme [Streptomyces sp. W1SF4]